MQSVNLANPVNRSSPLNRGLVLWYMPVPGIPRGPRLIDFCGKYHGTLTNGPVWRGGRFGNYGSITTDGSTNAVIASSVPQIAAPLSVLMRVKITSAVINGAFFSHDSGSGSNDGFRICVESDLLRFTLGSVNNYTAVNINPVNSQWSTFVVTWAGNGGAVNGYHYNHESGAYNSGSATSGTMSGTPSRITLSWDFSAYTFGAAMQVADVRVFNHVVSETKARILVRDALTGYQSSLNWTRPVYAQSAGGGGGGGGSIPVFMHHYKQLRAAA